MTRSRNILITGANGFLGSHLVKECCKLSDSKVFAAVRKTANIEAIQNLGCEIVRFDYNYGSEIEQFFRKIGNEGGFDLIIHNAAITIAADREDFFKTNFELSKSLFNKIKESNCLASDGKVAYISSFAAFGPSDNGKPVSAYGESKLMSENYLIESGLPYLIFRPTAIYGPGDKEFLPVFKSCKRGFFPLIASKKQRFRMIYVQDVATNIVDYYTKITREIVHLEDGYLYSNYDLKDSLAQALNRKVRFLEIPGLLVKLVAKVGTSLHKIFNTKLQLTVEKYLEVVGDWNYDFSEERKQIPLKIESPLQLGIKKTLAWYQETKLI